MCGTSNMKASQISARRKISRHLIHARSLCSGSFSSHGGSISFHQTSIDDMFGTVISTTNGGIDEISRNFKSVHGGNYTSDETALITDEREESVYSTPLPSVVSSEDLSFDQIGESDLVHKLEEISYHPAQLIPLKTMIFIRSNDLIINTCDRQDHNDRLSDPSLSATNSIKTHGHVQNLSLSNNTDDRWIAVNDIHNTSCNNDSSMSSPVARNTRDELTQRGLEFSSNKDLWMPDRNTKWYIKSQCSCLHDFAIPSSPLPASWKELLDDNVLLWTGNIGSQICLRAEAMIGKDAESLYKLLLDSSRVKEYNEVSLGREDIWIMERLNGCDGTNEVTKVVRGTNKAPVRGMSPIIFHSLMHGKELDGGAGYSIVTRTARLLSSGGDVTSSHTTLCIGTLLIYRIEGCDNQCILVNATQFTAPVPAMVARKLGLASNKTMFKALQKLSLKVR